MPRKERAVTFGGLKPGMLLLNVRSRFEGEVLGNPAQPEKLRFCPPEYVVVRVVGTGLWNHQRRWLRKNVTIKKEMPDE